jgi:imidazolonepropionase-like amidohydrolase
MAAAFALLLAAMSPVAAQRGAPPTVLRAARMLDVKSGNVVRNAVVVIVDGRIAEAGDHVSTRSRTRGSSSTCGS